jgi:hypothetical protein
MNVSEHLEWNGELKGALQFWFVILKEWSHLEDVHIMKKYY